MRLIVAAARALESVTLGAVSAGRASAPRQFTGPDFLGGLPRQLDRPALVDVVRAAP